MWTARLWARLWPSWLVRGPIGPRWKSLSWLFSRGGPAGSVCCMLWDAHRIPGQPWHAPETPIWWSPRVRQLLDLEDGESFDTLMQWAARLHPDDTNHVFARLTAHIEQRVPYDVDYRLRSNQGEYRWVRGRGQAIWNEQGELSRMSGSCQDITDRKLAEVALRVSEERFATAFNEASIGMALVSTDGHWFEVNQALCQIVGYSKEELQQTTFQALTHPDDLPKSLLLLERLLSGDLRTHQMEKRYLHKGGHIVWVNLNASSVRNHEGQVLYQIAQIQDITERKQAEEALRVSEERWQLAVRGSNDGIWDWMVQTGEVFYSTRWKTMRGFEEHEIRNHDEEWRNRIHPEDLDRVLRAVDAYLSKQIHEFYEEYRIQKKDGSYMWVLDRGMAIWADDGTPLRMAGSETDITARRQMEAELAEREERLRLLIEHSPVALAMLDHEMRYIAVSQRWRSDYRVGDGSLVGQSHYEVFPDIPERWKAIHRRCLAGAVEGCEEDPFIRTDGRTDWSRWEIRPWRTVEGSVGGIIIFSEDITARKQAEEALLVSQERYVRATVVGKVGVWELDVLQEQFHADDNLKALFGYSKDELSTDPFIWLNLVHPDDRAITLETWNQVSTGLVDSYSYEVRMIRKDGSIIWTHVRGQANRNDAGAVVRLIGATVDVTDRKCADERVLLTQFSIDRASDAVLWLDSGARIFNVNDAACRLLNYAREELTALSLYDLDPNVSTEGWALHWEELKQKETVTFESSYWSSTGQVVETEITSNYLQYGGKEYDCAIVRDITGRKHADAALRLAKFSMERAADAVYWIDPQARILDVNEAASLMLGYSKDELCAMTVHDLNPDFPAALWPGFWADTKQRGTMVLATAHRAKDGRLIPIEVSINYLAYEGQEYHCAFVRDITERKRAEQEVSERTQQTLTMQAALLRLTHLDETGGTPSDVLPRMCEIVAETLGVARVSVWLLSENGTALVCQNLYDRSQAVHSVGNRLSASQYPHYLETIAASLVLAAPDACADPRTIEFAEHYFLPLGITSMLDVPIRRQGTLVGVLWLEHVGVPRDWSPEAQSFGASVGEILGRMMETVERKRAESDLRQSHAFMRQVIDTDPNFIFAKDRDGRFTLVNQAVAEAYGTTVEGLIGKTDADFNLSPKEVAFFRQKDLEVMDSLQERFIPEEKITDVHGTSVGCKPSSGRL
ncbi:MAG: PAS domain S-box protein [Nitrospira sp.]|nr:PAS domain S-box protein [Nitrospira sp.]